MALKEHAREQAKSIAGKIGGGIVGLVVAGGLMWFTPLIDRFVKPAKPLANFATEEDADTMTVTFKNLSQNAKQAKWDFGDGSPIEIINGDQPEVKHRFKKANSYKVKLVVSNVVNQEDSRESTIAVGLKPQILDLSMKPVNQTTKPYTAGVKIKFEATADLDADLEWDFGDGIYQANKDTVVKDFPLPGKHLVKVRAVMGHAKGAPAVQEIEVLPQSGIVTTGGVQTPSGTTRSGAGRTAPITLSTEVIIRSKLTPDVLRKERLRSVVSQGKVTGSMMQETIDAAPGYLIKSPRFETSTLKKTANVINESVTTSEDSKRIIVKAQLNKPGTDYRFTSAVSYVEELDPSVVKESRAIQTAPGSSQLDLPQGSLHELEIKFRDQTVVKYGDLPFKAEEFSIGGRLFEVTCVKSGNKVKVQMRELNRQQRTQ